MRAAQLTFYFTCACLLVIIPTAVMSFTRQRRMVTEATLEQFNSLSASQEELLTVIVQLKQNITDISNLLSDASDAAKKLQDDNIETMHGTEEGIKKKIDAFANSLTESVEKLEKDTSTTYDSFKEQLENRKNRFIVKWHSKDGVKTSKRMTTEEEALDFYTTVGDFAKKLLMFDGNDWIVLKQYGGAEWLRSIKEDASIQDGDAKPTPETKKPKKAAEEDEAEDTPAPPKHHQRHVPKQRKIKAFRPVYEEDEGGEQEN